MHKPVGKVPGIFPPPGREDSLRAISKTLLQCRLAGYNNTRLAELLGCDKGTIANAIEESTLLSFDTVARLLFHFPEEGEFITALWTGSVVQPPTLRERFERVIREFETIEREVTAGEEG